MNRYFSRLATLGLLAGASFAANSVEALPSNVVDAAEVSVSGLSSGGFMAVQLHVAYSATFRKGIGVVAAGPYFCAEGSLPNAVGRCMKHTAAIPVAGLVNTTRSLASSGAIDAVSNLAGSKAYLFSGTRDSVVVPAVVNDLKNYYANFLSSADIVFKNDVPAEHSMVTEDFGNSCATKGNPYINDCDFDLAGAMLQHLHGAMSPRNNGALQGRVIEFSQTSFISGHGMGTSGFAFVPKGCTSDARCKLHAVMHGCGQSNLRIGMQYVERTGYNRWADTNRMIVLYPQIGPDATNGCWDWWGYDSPDYAKKSGPQMAAVKKMVDVLIGAGPSAGGGNEVASCHTSSNFGHVLAGRARFAFASIVAKGSDQPLGFWFGSSTLREQPPGHFEVGSCTSPSA
jgi:poly(3-hydroxybutyrate) depolymerase